MVLSSYSKWETDFHSEPLIHQTTTVEAADHLVAVDNLLDFYCDPFDQFPFPCIDPYIELNNNFLHPENYSTPDPYVDPFISLPLETTTAPYENFSSYPCPKRQIFIQDPYLMPPGFFDGHHQVAALNSCPVLEDDHHQSQHRINLEGTKSSVGNCKKNSDEKCVSAQSIAARERRRKITKKTQELGKLVPGGSKMNTAEMLQAAFNYVKYLQAQLGILQLMSSCQENKEGNCCKENENMEIVASPKLQEKFYMEEKCLVPKDFV